MSRSRNRFFLKILAFIAAIALLAVGWLVYSTETNLARPAAAAQTALLGDEVVSVDAADWLVMQPVKASPTAGFILYPGANCDIRGYSPVLRKIAAAGYLVVAMTMPFDLAIFAPNQADDVRAEFPQIRDWVVAGHSLGGAVASRYAFQHEDELAGLILWDAYPAETNSLAESSLPVMHIYRATVDGSPAPIFLDKRHLFPADAQWVPVPGGMHMYFGSFDGGGYKEEWQPGISRDVQQEIVVDAMLQGLAQMSSQ